MKRPPLPASNFVALLPIGLFAMTGLLLRRYTDEGMPLDLAMAVACGSFGAALVWALIQPHLAASSRPLQPEYQGHES